MNFCILLMGIFWRTIDIMSGIYFQDSGLVARSVGHRFEGFSMSMDNSPALARYRVSLQALGSPHFLDLSPRIPSWLQLHFRLVGLSVFFL